MIKNIASVFQIILGLALIILVVMQSKGGGLGSSIMGGTSVYSTKRGVEKAIFKLTIAVAFLFFVSSIVLLVA